MLVQPSELRCEECNKLLLGISNDFAGAVSIRCQRCKEDRWYPFGVGIQPTPIRCVCRKWLASGHVTQGSIRVACSRDRVLAILTPSGVLLAESSRSTLGKPKARKTDEAPLIERQREWGRERDEAFLALLDHRLQSGRDRILRRSVDLAVGLRFDVFNRDGFRCRYCGRGPEQGVFLEADHVLPRSAGGPDTMANLVTACWDCNRGKSAKSLAVS